MKWLFRILFSLFFAIAIGVHIYYLIESDHQPAWWHLLYFISYGVCWWMIFSGGPYRGSIYALMSIFPFVTHVYEGYYHLQEKDITFLVCLLVCIFLPLGYILIRKEII